MYLLDDVGFICHPNTGSRSLGKAILAAKGSLVKGHHEVCAKALAKTRACICVIRNPYDIMASWYCKKNEPGKFSVWVANILQGRRNFQGPPPCGLFYGLNWATDVVKFEDLPGGLNRVTNKLGLPRLKLGHEGNSGKTSDYYHSLYDKDDLARFLVRSAFDFQIQAGQYRL